MRRTTCTLSCALVLACTERNATTSAADVDESKSEPAVSPTEIEKQPATTASEFTATLELMPGNVGCYLDLADGHEFPLVDVDGSQIVLLGREQIMYGDEGDVDSEGLFHLRPGQSDTYSHAYTQTGIAVIDWKTVEDPSTCAAASTQAAAGLDAANAHLRGKRWRTMSPVATFDVGAWPCREAPCPCASGSSMNLCVSKFGFFVELLEDEWEPYRATELYVDLELCLAVALHEQQGDDVWKKTAAEVFEFSTIVDALGLEAPVACES